MKCNQSFNELIGTARTLMLLYVKSLMSSREVGKNGSQQIPGTHLPFKRFYT